MSGPKGIRTDQVRGRRGGRVWRDIQNFLAAIGGARELQVGTSPEYDRRTDRFIRCWIALKAKDRLLRVSQRSAMELSKMCRTAEGRALADIAHSLDEAIFIAARYEAARPTIKQARALEASIRREIAAQATGGETKH